MNALFNHKAISCDTDGENVQVGTVKKAGGGQGRGAKAKSALVLQ